MSASAVTDPADIVARLQRAGSAEEFFELLGVEYDPKLLNVARLHILRRMGQYLAGEDLEHLPGDEAAARCKAVLERAYADFVASSPLDQRVFKVLKDAVAPKAPKRPAFVPLDALK
ncbi:nitrogenase-stabilizing/protective protein [Rhodopseudomonas thermotolerans]|uniref:Nitrogenase-stabilizing/protective protein NifW n=2 Tax=Rhodopseudomonas TaxID=1073 RepID=A0A336JMV8_9BRAD|nr:MULTISPECIES: nitrogenase stabilizing/protective protein NifW [Rhodopseudomonas]RED36272.1 nitrogenase-stabilizing/protective protein [Rhodopseudomonas pentothenatexigens]REG03645.1 nitrogenase-stabilizing/protective protein [Rhodopseudomonas thermotolerans]SSW90832.1 nitrogenase-stabilizing/protective protein [Rhodopseudomonas pentothenatexigens]